MSDIAIQVENVAKLYHIGEKRVYKTARESVMNVLNAPARVAKKLFGPPPPPKVDDTELWALKNVSFTINQGEVVGIIGRNGAGKSTLLKVLSRITEPTRGRITIHGRVGSLLEVGTGFHPELTGRENIFLNGAILGMRRNEITSKFDEIVAFSEIEKFIDTPVKFYSSGMYMRLAFAVAAHLEPEILIVDEVLAVGDIQFQKKCLGKMRDVAGDGRTVLFVSHNMHAIRSLTKRCVVLRHGQVASVDVTETAIRYYEESGAEINGESYDLTTASRPSGFRPNGARFLQTRFRKEHGAIFQLNEDIEFEITYESQVQIDDGRISLTVFRFDGTPIGSAFGPSQLHLQPGSDGQTVITMAKPPLAPGKYYVGMSLGSGDPRRGNKDFDIVLNVLHFEIQPETGDSGTLAQWPTEYWGAIRLPEIVYTVS